MASSSSTTWAMFVWGILNSPAGGIHMIMLVLFSNLTGVLFAEWKGTLGPHQDDDCPQFGDFDFVDLVVGLWKFSRICGEARQYGGHQ